MEGHEHKIQRKLIAPAFSSQSIKHLTSIFISKAEEACNIWEKDLKAQQTAGSAAPVVDVTQLLSRAAFDAIGLGGFGYAFDSVKDEASPDRQPFNSIFRIADQGIDLRDTLDLYVPILRKLWVRDFPPMTHASPPASTTETRTLAHEEGHGTQPEPCRDKKIWA